MGRRTASLDKLIGDRAVSVGDFVADDEFARPDRVVEDLTLRHEIRVVMAKLPERECEVLLRRYGLTPGQHAETLEQVGHRFGVTRERIRQIEKKALTRLRQSHAEELRDFAESLMEV
jgi:RNA polymerase primary sigma factor